MFDFWTTFGRKIGVTTSLPKSTEKFATGWKFWANRFLVIIFFKSSGVNPLLN